MKKIMRNTIILLVMFVAAVLFAQSKMELHAADTGIAGDANRDSVVDVKDLVRAKRFAKDLQDNVPVEDRIAISADIDLDKDLNINDTDTRYLRVLLIGEYNATVIPDDKDVDVGKYDKVDDTFDIAVPNSVELADDAKLVSATFQQHAATSTQPFTTLGYANGVVTLNNSLLGDRAFDDIQLVFETGSARVDVINIPIDCFAMVINDEAELNRFPIVAQAHPAGYYILGNDIYCEGTYVSNHNVQFSGTFNGCNYTIYNMNVECGDKEYGGFFGRNFGFTSPSSAYLKYISFVNASYSGVGGFIASQIGGTMEDVYIDITMKNCGTGTNINSSAVLGTNSYGALNVKRVLINYQEPLVSGAQTGTAVYEMHPHCDSYQGLYVIGADTVGVHLTATPTASHVCGAYLTEAEFLAAISSGEVDLSSWDDGFWKISDGEVPIPIPLAKKSDAKIGVISDIHFVDSNNGQREVNLKRALTYYKEQGADVIIMNGDISDAGTVASYQELVRVIDEVYPAGSTRPTFISTADSHEYYDAWSWKSNTATYQETQERFLTNFAKKVGQESLNTHKKINGYHFIGVSSDSSEANGTHGLAGYSEATVQWLEGALAEAAAEDPTKPIFVAVHQPPRNTVTSSTVLGNGNEALTGILGKYPQAVVFTSHTHSSIKQENSIYQKDFTVVNTGGLFYIGGDEMEYTNTGNTADYLLHAYNFAEGLLVSVTGDKVNIERRDFFNQEKIKSNWVIVEPSNKESFTYTDARKDARVAPVFAEGTALTVEKYSNDSVVLKFPSATHADFVQYYTVKVTDASGNPVQLYKLGTGKPATTPNYVTDFYFGISRMASHQELVVKGLQAGERYTFEVCAVETFGKTSSPLTATYEYHAVDNTVEVAEVQNVSLSSYRKENNNIIVSKAETITVNLSAYANSIQGQPVEAVNETLGRAITIDGASQATTVVLSAADFGTSRGVQRLAIYFDKTEGGKVTRTKVSVDILLCTYVFKTADDLDAFGALAKAESASPAVWDGYFVLGNDIAYNKQFTPFITRETINKATGKNVWVEVADYGFKGVFDGLGHTIEGLEIVMTGTYSTSNEVNAEGFIGLLNNTGVIRNVAFTNAAFTGAGNQGGGFISYASNGTMENIYVSYARLANAGTGNVGTFIGVDSRAAARIKNCYVDLTGATVSGSNVWAIGRVHEGYGVVNRVYVTGLTSAIQNLSSASGEANLYGAYATRAEMKAANIAITATNGWNMSYWTTDADGLPIFK